MSLFLRKNIYKPKSTVICVSPMPREFYYNQHEIFKKFGKLRFVGIDECLKEQVAIAGFIEFEEDDDSVAAELLSKGYIEIEDNKYHVKSYTEYIEDITKVSTTILKFDNAIDPLLEPPDEKSPKNILNKLNNDCLRDIFRKLHFSTLNSVANVCTRFNCIAKEAFSIKYKFKKINIADLEWDRQPNLLQFRNFLLTFGSSITSLSLLRRAVTPYYNRNIKDTDTLLKMINDNCKNLVELEFSGLDVHEQTLFEMRALLQRLQTLRMQEITTRSIFDIISVCSELKILELHFDYSMTNCDALPQPNNVHLHLVEAIFPWDCTFAFTNAIDAFIKLNTQLRILRVKYLFNYAVANLRELSELNVFKMNLSSNINMTGGVMDILYSPDVYIDNLELDVNSVHFGGDQFINNISKFQTVTKLRIRFVHYLNVRRLILLVKNLPNLKALSFNLYKMKDFDSKNTNEAFIINSILPYANNLSDLVFMTKRKAIPFCHYPVDNATYYTILETVSNRNSGIKLTIDFLFSAKNSQSIHTLDMVPHLLTIHQRTYHKMYDMFM